jgi:large subunit ribosomal protein L7Ae
MEFQKNYKAQMGKKNRGNRKTANRRTDNKFKNLFERTPKNLSIGGNVRPKRDLTRYVKWPKYILLQRQRRVLYDRIKIPGALNQFSYTLTRDKAKTVLNLLEKYRPETRAEKRKRLEGVAEKKVDKKNLDPSKKPYMVKTGLNHITTLVESKKAKLVVIAHDVDPIELVLWLPSLCRQMGVPFCFVKSKARLGKVVNLKNATCLALTDVRTEDEAALKRIVEVCNNEYNTSTDYFTHKSGIVLGQKSKHKQEKKQKMTENEMINRA